MADSEGVVKFTEPVVAAFQFAGHEGAQAFVEGPRPKEGDAVELVCTYSDDNEMRFNIRIKKETE